MDFGLSGKVALITGGSRGIGAAAVEVFVKSGAFVFFNYQNARSQAERLVENLGKNKCAALECDLAGTDSAKLLVEAVAKHFGRLDILVANHGVWPSQPVPIDEMSAAQWHSTVSVNLDSVYALLKHSVRQMKSQLKDDSTPRGHIVLVSSTAGQRGEAFHCDYAATKGALISMVKGLSTELAPDNIYVNCVAPGWVDTDMSAETLGDPEMRKRVLATIPLGRVATPQEIAAPILFLCTPFAGFITGEILNVNGGAVLSG